MSITLLIPSRGRPADAKAALWSALDHAVLPETRVEVVIDTDDPELEAYDALGPEVVKASSRRGIVDPLNQAALSEAAGSGHVGFMGDDHRVRTMGWDAIVDTYAGTTIVYGDDLFQHENLPTAVFMSGKAIKALGYMAPPVLQHLYVDNYWRDLGESLGSIKYIPELVIEHLHPHINDVKGKPKGTWDALKQELNSGGMYERDRLAYEKFVADGMLAKDVERLVRG